MSPRLPSVWGSHRRPLCRLSQVQDVVPALTGPLSRLLEAHSLPVIHDGDGLQRLKLGELEVDVTWSAPTSSAFQMASAG